MNGSAFFAATALTAAIAGFWPAAGTAEANSIFLPAPPSPVPLSAGWQPRDCGAFRIRTPDDTVVQRNGRHRGTLIDRRFTLSYYVGLAVDDSLARSGLDGREKVVDVAGRAAVKRTAEFPGRVEPYFLSLTVPQAVRARDGRWRALEIHGWFATTERRWLAEQVAFSIDFGKPFDRPLQPVKPYVPLPTITVADGTERGAS